MPLDCTTKQCSKCGIEQPHTDFPRSARNKDGRMARCKTCNKLAGRAYYAANRAQVIARTRQYILEHPETLRKAKRKWQATHRAQHLTSTRQRSAKWREQNREKDRAASKRWQKANPAAYRAIQHRRRARVRGSSGSYTAGQWEALKAQYNHRCLCCGRYEPDIVLTIDHVIPIALGGSNDISNIQPLCLSCNCSKQDRATDYRP